ncbi:MAG: carboxypeptidase regulatory-like domain-containing protein [Chitinophagaceae bacterium]|nr:MAG: carboxypeptidase regulatory-like domain-containing protein [Chitinophagaceae bacterium]
MKVRLLLLVGLLAGVSLGARANASTSPGAGEESTRKTDIAGGVFHSESRKPLGNVTVTAYSNNQKQKVVQTDASGGFAFDDLKPGTYRFVFEKAGYRKVVKEKTIQRVDEATELNVSLEEHSTYDFTPGPAHFFDFQ